MADRKKRTDIFREKSLEQITSPESLDMYIKSTTPSLWLLLCTIITLLVGVIVWSTVGKIDSYSIVGCRAQDGMVTAYIKETEYGKLCEESYVEINGERFDITTVTGPTIANEDNDRFLAQAAEIEDGTWYYSLNITADIVDGNYKGKVVYEKISPITFIMN